MPIIHNVEQNSESWEKIKLGIPSASSYEKIITPTGAASTQADAYANRLVAEWITGKTANEFEGNGWTERGHEKEPECAAMYAMIKNVTPVKVGFITDDKGTIGCSPDRLIDDHGILEMKNPSIHVHMSYVFDNKKLIKEYHVQNQVQLHVSKRSWVDLFSYCEGLPNVIMRVVPDLDFQMKIIAAHTKFTALLTSKKQQLIDMGYVPIQDNPDFGKEIMAG